MQANTTMASLYVYLLLPLLLLFTTTSTFAASSANRCAPGVRGAYWPSWAASAFPPSAINTALFTHLYFAFLLPNTTTFGLDVPDSIAPLLIDFTSTLHKKNPLMKTLISLGGGGGDPALFARIAADPSKRRTFIRSTIEVARKYGFDGLDLDWESPANPKEMVDFGKLIDEWRLAVEREAVTTSKPRLLLTAAVYFAPEFFLSEVRRAFPANSMGKSLDLINVMCYDYHGSWDTSKTGAHAALYDPTSNISTSYGLQSWLKTKVPPLKVIMGLPLYGRTWKLKDPKLHGIRDPAVGVGPGDEGTMRYSEVEDFNSKNNAVVVYDSTTVSTYSYAGTSWIGYDGTNSTAVKVRFAKSLGVGGYFFWAVNGDSKWKISNQAYMAWNR